MREDRAYKVCATEVFFKNLVKGLFGAVHLGDPLSLYRDNLPQEGGRVRNISSLKEIYNDDGSIIKIYQITIENPPILSSIGEIKLIISEDIILDIITGERLVYRKGRVESLEVYDNSLIVKAVIDGKKYKVALKPNGDKIIEEI
ncbi:MAG: hypothetical protein QXK42_05530 [Candidatus Korarchaeum sp.]